MKRILAIIITTQISTTASVPGEESPKPPAIRTDGVPELSRELLRSLKPYQEVRTASFVDWHPRGGILVSSRIDNLHRLYHVPSAGAPPVRITGGEEPVTRGRCLPGGEIVFQVGSGGDENFQIEISAGPGQPSTRLTDGKSRNVFGPPDRGGRRLPFNSTRRNGRDLDLYLLDLDRAGATPELLFEVAEENWSVEDWSQDGSRALLLHYLSANEARLHLLDIASRERKPLPLEEAVRSVPATRVSRDVPRFGPGSRKVYYASDARGQFRELVCMDPGTGREEWLTGDLPHDVEDLDVSRDGRRAAFSVNADGFSRLFILDLELFESKGAEAARAARVEVSLGRCVISGLRFSPDSAGLGLTLARASSPAEAYGYDLGSGILTRWTLSERAGFREEDFTEPELIRYRSFDELEVPAFIYVPRREDEGKRLPVIVIIHGGPESQVRPNYSSRIQYYVREVGAAVITPNVRGSTGYGKKYSLLDNGVLREDSVRDIGALLDWVSRDDRFDASRVAVVGGSYGGYMVLASLVRFGSRIRAGVDVVGVSDFNTLLRNTSAYRRELRRAEYGDERDPAMQSFFEKISPAKRMDSIRSALLIIHGANDPRVPLSEAEQIVERARRSGNPVWTLYAQNEGHGFTRRENTDYEEAATVEFLRRHLLASKPDEAGARPAAAPEDGPTLHAKAIDLFHRKEFRASVEEFDRAIQAGGQTHTSDACWERGLALYYAGDPTKAREQFDAYHRVDPLDIENGLWRYLCVAAGDGAEKAREALPAYERKTRPPFPALLDLYAGRGTIEAVLEQASAGATGTRRDENLFYAHFYVAKHLQAKKDPAAREHIEKALAKPVDHFMYACAKIESER